MAASAAAALVLILVIGIAVFFKPTSVAWAGRIAAESDVPTESSLPSTGIIPIFNAANEIQSEIPVANILNLFWGQSSPIAKGTRICDATRQSETVTKLIGPRGAGFIGFVIWWTLRETSYFRKNEGDIIKVDDDSSSISNIYDIQCDFDWLSAPNIADQPNML